MHDCMHGCLAADRLARVCMHGLILLTHGPHKFSGQCVKPIGMKEFSSHQVRDIDSIGGFR